MQFAFIPEDQPAEPFDKLFEQKSHTLWKKKTKNFGANNEPLAPFYIVVPFAFYFACVWIVAHKSTIMIIHTFKRACGGPYR